MTIPGGVVDVVGVGGHQLTVTANSWMARGILIEMLRSGRPSETVWVDRDEVALISRIWMADTVEEIRRPARPSTE